MIEDADELVLPIHQVIEFRITSSDVLHSFWIPGFRQKMDAVPGRVTTFQVTPTIETSFAESTQMRVQCAEICGTGHARMRTRVLVLSEAEFESWITETKAAGLAPDERAKAAAQ